MKRILGLLALCMLLVQPVSAASLYMDPARSTLERGDAAIIAVRLDTDELAEECINAVEGVLTFNGPVEPVDVSLGNSIFSIWVETPTISADKRQVTFAGGIPNGYCGRIEGDPRLTNTLFEVVVRTDAISPADDQPVTATISFTNQTFAYQNDGLGTRAETNLYDNEITVLPQLSSAVLDPWRDVVTADTQNPQEFSIQLVQQPLLFNGRYYITFNTTDKQTGVDRYEVMEEPISQFTSFTWGSASAPWIEARSPYVLKDQSLNSIIRVRAIDKAGNQYIATYIPDNNLRTVPLTQIALFILLGVSLIVLLYGLYTFMRRRRAIKEEQALAEVFTTPEQAAFESPTQTQTLPETENTTYDHDQRS